MIRAILASHSRDNSIVFFNSPDFRLLKVTMRFRGSVIFFILIFLRPMASSSRWVSWFQAQGRGHATMKSTLVPEWVSSRSCTWTHPSGGGRDARTNLDMAMMCPLLFFVVVFHNIYFLLWLLLSSIEKQHVCICEGIQDNRSINVHYLHIGYKSSLIGISMYNVAFKVPFGQIFVSGGILCYIFQDSPRNTNDDWRRSDGVEGLNPRLSTLSVIFMQIHTFVTNMSF